MTDETDKPGEAVRKIRRLLADWLRTSKDSREPVADILDLLEVIDDHIRSSPANSVQIFEDKAAAGGRGSAATYTIDKKRNEDEVLTEHRPGGQSQPFRCPHYLFTAIVEVLAGSDPSVDFDGLMKALKKLELEPAEFQVRAALRFLMSITPAILTRDRNRYRPVAAAHFEHDSKVAWTALLKAKKRA